MAGAERNRTEKEVILKPRKKQLASIEQLIEACLPTLTARLWATCCWPRTMDEGWKIGDYNFLIASVSPDEQSSLYVQFWSEPHEPVLAEVCSGEWNPGAVKYVRQRQRKLIEGLGYKVGGRAHNFQKEVRIETAAEAEAAAREVLGIFFDVFGYRGQWPLELKYYQGERADREPVYQSVTPEDFAKLSAHLGFGVDLRLDPEPIVLLRQGRRRFAAALSGRVPDSNLYSLVVLETLVPVPVPVTDKLLLRINDTLQLAQVARHDPRTLFMRLPLRLDGGVTVRWMANAFQHWLAEWRACERMVKGARKVSAAPAKGRPSSGAAVH